MKFSTRAQRLGTENAFVVLKEVNYLSNNGNDVINFCIGQPDFDTPQHIKAVAIKAIQAGKTGYTESAGIPPLRDAIANYLATTRNLDITAESVVVANGAKPFIGYTVLCTTDYGVGHEVLYPNPGFPIYESQIQAHGAVPVPYSLRERNDYRLDVEELRHKINERTRLLILNSPHNPTGSVLTATDMDAIAEVLEGYKDVWILSDEIYSRLVYGAPFTSITSIPELQDRTIIVDGVSKTYAMTGWRIGFAANALLAPSFARWMINTDSCAGHPNQYAALAALTGPQEDVEQMIRHYRRRGELLAKGLNGIQGVSCPLPGGAFYVWPNVTKACERLNAVDSEDFRKRLLHETGVAVLSDVHFGHKIAGEGEHVRFSYATSEANIAEGLQRLQAYLE